MKRIGSFISALPLLFLFLCLYGSFSSHAEESEAVALSCTASATQEDGTTEVSVELTNAEGLEMLQFQVFYDPDFLLCTGAEAGNVLTGKDPTPTINFSEPGKVYFVWDSLTPLSEEGTVLTLKMQGYGQVGVLTEDEDLVAADGEYHLYPVECSDCYIELTENVKPIEKKTSQFETEASDEEDLDEEETELEEPDADGSGDRSIRKERVQERGKGTADLWLAAAFVVIAAIAAILLIRINRESKTEGRK